jgi:mannosyltransferase
VRWLVAGRSQANPARREPAQTAVLWTLAGLTALGLAIRFSTLGLQSYHHDEVITAGRVISGSFGHMLHEVKASESNPPLYYVLAWGWARAFGDAEFGLRSLSALFGAATVPALYFATRELSSRRAGLIAAAIAAVNPVLIWYSQEARSYAVLVFFCALSFAFFARSLRTRQGRDLALWALSSALAFSSHYFAAFLIGIEALWLLVALRSRWRSVALAIGGVAAVGLALAPLLAAQANPGHISWIEHRSLFMRIAETGAVFLIGETGHVIGEPSHGLFAIVPALLVAAALCLGGWACAPREKRGMTIGLVVGVGVIALAMLAALAGKDYVIARNLLPAFAPLCVAVAIALAARSAKGAGLFLATLLCAYWLAFDIHVDTTSNLQRLDVRELARKLGPPARPRAVVSWVLAGAPLIFYLDDGAQHLRVRVREVDVVSKPQAAGRRGNLPPAFRAAGQVKLGRLTLTRYMARRPQPIPYRLLRHLPTGFVNNTVLVDGEPGQASAGRAALTPGFAPYHLSGGSTRPAAGASQ